STERHRCQSRRGRNALMAQAPTAGRRDRRRDSRSLPRAADALSPISKVISDRTIWLVPPSALVFGDLVEDRLPRHLRRQAGVERHAGGRAVVRATSDWAVDAAAGPQSTPEPAHRAARAVSPAPDRRRT